jgi:hypothetical protein
MLDLTKKFENKKRKTRRVPRVMMMIQIQIIQKRP